MSSPTADDPMALAADGPAAPPRVNGELVFDAPWQSRAFGVAAALADEGRLAWADLQAALITRVATADAGGEDTGTPTVYWTCWLDAVGAVVADAGELTDHEWLTTSRALADRPAGHDHGHHHGHGHEDGHDHEHEDHHDHDHEDHPDHGHEHTGGVDARAVE